MKLNFEFQSQIFNYDISNVSILYDGGRSGSIFLQSLLDSHSEVITFPSTLLIGGLTGIHFDDFFLANYKNNSEEIAFNFTKSYSTAFDSSIDLTASRLNQLGENRDQKIEVSKEVFIEKYIYLSKFYNKNTYKNVFNTIHIAWAQALGKELKQKILIVHALHTPEDKMKLYCEAFPESKHLVCVRDPIISHNSRFLHHIKRYNIKKFEVNFFQNKLNIGYPLSMMKDVLFAPRIIGKYADFSNTRCVRNEDLHNVPEATLKKLCLFLEIDFENCLMESTFLGLKHWGDDTIEPRNGFSGGLKKISTNHLSSFNKQDLEMIEELIKARIHHFGYTRLTRQTKISNRKLNKIMKWEEISLNALFENKIWLAAIVIKIGSLSKFLRKFWLRLLCMFLKSTESELLREWDFYIDKRVELIKTFMQIEKNNPEPKFELI